MAATARGMTMNKPSGSMASELQAASFEDAATELGSVLAEYVSVSRVFLVFESQPTHLSVLFFHFPFTQRGCRVSGGPRRRYVFCLPP